MNNAISRIKRRKRAKEALESICTQQTNYLIIHYSCESFYDTPQGRTPRITSIAVRYFDTAQTKSFSIHKVAEFKNVPFGQIEQQYDSLEKIMLDEFFSFVGIHKRYSWIHLNMRDINYGFEAINHRYLVLGGEPVEIADNAKIDLGRLLVELYGTNYIEHPRIESLCKKNNMTMTNFLTGAEEAIAFNKQEYVKLHQSTLRKVDNMQSIILRAYEGELKTNSNLIKQYGLTPQSIFQLIQENWIFALVVFLLGIIITILLEKLV
jgi:hypothetical protein